MSNTKTTEVIGIASGKGGVGKTTVSINLAVALAQRGHDVMLFDADLGLANAQIALGARAEYNLSHFLAGQKTLEEITLKTRQGIQLIPGASGMQELAALSQIQAASIVQAFSNLGKNVVSRRLCWPFWQPVTAVLWWCKTTPLPSLMPTAPSK
jgi:flagellar biosynthesis protein FlhG